MSDPRYRDAGVDIDAGERVVARIRAAVTGTHTPHVLGGIGGFGGLCAIPSGMQDPVLVSGTDGVGTKLIVARMVGRHDTIGQDLVAMSVNDILVCGARPLFFLDYFACGHLDEDQAVTVIEGIAAACAEAGCALLGGETAEMPGCYPPGEYDLAGFAVGVVERSRILDGSAVRPGDVLVGLPSTGLHSNGYSLARQVLFNRLRLGVDDPLPGTDRTVGDTLLVPTRLYPGLVLPLVDQGWVRGIAHITGGGLVDNLPRALPEGCGAQIYAGSWPEPAVFQVLREHGHVPEAEMHRTFNLGIGMVLIASPEDVVRIEAALAARNEPCHRIGEVVAGERRVTLA
ncbi:MAG: phosphoribosylformylglycinamidine cyclo-ligase [Nitrospirota bacterium]|jgi:phosphoribosylformylglycinamidine cyclo-ligase